jgi:hypothetical protein
MSKIPESFQIRVFLSRNEVGGFPSIIGVPAHHLVITAQVLPNEGELLFFPSNLLIGRMDLRYLFDEEGLKFLLEHQQCNQRDGQAKDQIANGHPISPG